MVRNLGALRIDDVAIEVKALGSEVYEIRPDDPASVRSEASRLAELRRGGWHVTVETRSVLTMEGDNWRLKARIEARDGGKMIFSRCWDMALPRSSAEGRPPGHRTFGSWE